MTDKRAAALEADIDLARTYLRRICDGEKLFMSIPARKDDFDLVFDRVIRAAQASTPAEWQPIADAPRDGRHILLCVPGEDLDFKKGSVARCIGYYGAKYTVPAHDDIWEPEKHEGEFEYQESSGEWFAKEGFFFNSFENSYGDELAKRINPTHFMPLPKPPAQKE